MFSQTVAGMRGLGHVYRAVGDMLPVFGGVKDKPVFPEGWAPDNAAFKCGLDMSTKSMTSADVKAITGWYEKTIGIVPKSIQFALKYHPDMLKAYRAKWEVCFKLLPKQTAPYIMLRHNIMTGNKQALREAVLLGKAWGITSDRMSKGISASAFYFTGFDGLYDVEEMVGDLL